MFEYRLRFKTEDEAKGVLFRSDGSAKYQNLDIVGDAFKTVDSVSTKINGWHVNVYSDKKLPELEQYAVDVKSPIRVRA
jgi:TPP-dependent trihydroxycyclohexane-1,2-dione (THcHDO) dehydratase